MVELTQKQKDILHFITDYKRDHDMSPAMRDIADHFNSEIKPVYDQLCALRKKGRITWQDRISRSIKVLYDCDNDRELCRAKFLETAIEDNPGNWHIWKRAWTTARGEA